MNEGPVQPPSVFAYRMTVGPSSSRARMIALYAFEFRSRPRWIAAGVLACLMLVAGVVMLIAGGPLAWQWCLLWIGGCLWSLVPFGIQMMRNIRAAGRRDRVGDILESAFDDRAMWIRNGERLTRLPFDEYSLSGRSKRFGYLAPSERGRMGVVLPVELFPQSPGVK